jgi:hypothetical protein
MSIELKGGQKGKQRRKGSIFDTVIKICHFSWGKIGNIAFFAVWFDVGGWMLFMKGIWYMS